VAEKEVLKEFLVKLGFDIEESKIGQFEATILKASAGVTAFAASIGAMAGMIVDGVKEVAEENKQLGLLAKQLNASAEEVDNFIDTAGIMGISQQTATESLKNFSGAVQDAGMGIGRSKAIFEKLGISVKDASGHVRSATEVMGDLQEKLQGMERGQQLRVMERLGLDPKMLMMFNASLGTTKYISTELSKIDVAAGFNLDKTIAASNEFTGKWKAMSMEINLFHTLISKIKESLATYLMPKIGEAIDKVKDAIYNMRVSAMDAAPRIIAFFKPILDFILNMAAGMIQLGVRGFKFVIDLATRAISLFMDLNEKTGGWIPIIVGIIGAWQLLNKMFLSSPVGRLILLGAAIMMLYDDFLTFKEGGESLINWNSDFAQGLIYIVQLLKEAGAIYVAGKAIIMAWSIGMKLAAATTKALATAQAALNFIMNMNPIVRIIALITMLGVAGYELIKHWQVVKNWFASFFGSFTDGFKKAGDMIGKLTGIFGGGGGVNLGVTAGAAVAGGSHHVNQVTNINVNGAGDPTAVGKAVAGHQDKVNQGMARNNSARVR
jgi:Phage-related minor tail protein